MAKVTYLCRRSLRGYLDGRRYSDAYVAEELDDLEEARDYIEGLAMIDQYLYASYCVGFTAPIIDHRNGDEIALHVPGQPDFEILYTVEKKRIND